MKRLGVDLSLPEGSVSVEVDGEVVSSVVWKRPKLHAEVVFSQIENALKLAGVKREEIEEVVVSSGPGSFTGVRLSVSTGKAFKECGVKVLSSTTLKALKHGYGSLGLTPVPIIPARRGKYYAELKGREADLTAEEILKELSLLKNPLIVWKGELPPQLKEFPNVEERAPLSTKLLLIPREELSPLTFHYVRDHDAKPQCRNL